MLLDKQCSSHQLPVWWWNASGGKSSGYYKTTNGNQKALDTNILYTKSPSCITTRLLIKFRPLPYPFINSAFPGLSLPSLPQRLQTEQRKQCEFAYGFELCTTNCQNMFSLKVNIFVYLLCYIYARPIDWPKGSNLIPWMHHWCKPNWKPYRWL